ncbi:MAG: response regulator, partial [Candidatus Marinimicrobia bacterium]|nr:response regulator [Candidatus Neomarinimicrobiota bacterium]
MTKKRRILIIEDDPSFAKLLERHLDKVSVTIDHVDNGTEGLSRIKSDLPDVVLLDLNLPDSN